MSKKYYKVVTSDGAGALSFNAGDNPIEQIREGILLRYGKNVTTTPVIADSKLFVFDSVKAAETLYLPGCTEIWECEVSNPKKMRSHPPGEMTPRMIKSFWKRRVARKKPHHHLVKAWRGTYCVDSVKLTKLVYK